MLLIEKKITKEVQATGEEFREEVQKRKLGTERYIPVVIAKESTCTE